MVVAAGALFRTPRARRVAHSTMRCNEESSEKAAQRHTARSQGKGKQMPRLKRGSGTSRNASHKDDGGSVSPLMSICGRLEWPSGATRRE